MTIDDLLDLCEEIHFTKIHNDQRTVYYTLAYRLTDDHPIVVAFGDTAQQALKHLAERITETGWT